MKHSNNLEKWMKKIANRGNGKYIACFSGISMIDGSEIDYDKNKTQAHQILIGFGDFDDGYLHGSRLSEIITMGSRANTWAYSVKQFGIIELPNWFEEYKEKGVCFIDPMHTLYSNWITDSDTERHCQYCGYKQKRETTLVEHYQWKFV